MERRRRIDRVLQDDYLADLTDRSTDEIRAMRDECEEEESGVSYARRVLQGRLDILRAEALRRRATGSEGLDAILSSLPDILSEQRGNTPITQARVTRFLVPPAVRYHRRQVEQDVDQQVLDRITECSTKELGEAMARLALRESELSETRRELLDRIDALQSELARRYKSGAASVADVLARHR